MEKIRHTHKESINVLKPSKSEVFVDEVILPSELNILKRELRNSNNSEGLVFDIAWESSDRINKDEQGRKYINEQITKARERLLQEITDETTGKRTYSIEFDMAAYRMLSNYEDLPGYIKARDELNSYTKFQLQTLLGERFHTGLSSYKSAIRDGVLCAGGMDEPMVDVLERGREFRKTHGSMDQEREEAEVIGFRKIQEILGDSETLAGAMMISISPPGNEESIYLHNFYDVFIKRVNEDGDPFVEVKRYSSALSVVEASRKVREINPGYGEGGIVDDVYFLSNPIQVDSTYGKFRTPDQVHEFLHKEHITMSEEEFQKILEICIPAILGYINLLCDDPIDDNAQKLAFNAILNIADQAANELNNRKRDQNTNEFSFGITGDFNKTMPLGHAEIFVLGSLPVREAKTGCGNSSGYAVANEMYTQFGNSSVMTFNASPYSVSSFGIKKSEEERWTYKIGKCIVCKEEDVMVGPCSICKDSCEGMFDKGYIYKNEQWVKE